MSHRRVSIASQVGCQGSGRTPVPRSDWNRCLPGIERRGHRSTMCRRSSASRRSTALCCLRTTRSCCGTSNVEGAGTVPPETDLAAWAVGCAVLAAADSLEDASSDETLDGAGQGSLGSELVADDALLWRIPSPMPRAWFVSQVRVLPPLATNHWQQIWLRTSDVLYQGVGFRQKGELRDLRREATVEATEEELTSAGVCQSDGLETDATRAHCQIVSYTPSRVELQVETAQAGLVVLAEQFFPGWQAEVETGGQGMRRVPILRTNRVMRGVWLNEGEHRVVFRYRPMSVVYGGVLSAGGWLVLLMWGIISIGRAATRVVARRDATALGARCRSTTSHARL